jgi:hypothetical protein
VPWLTGLLPVVALSYVRKLSASFRQCKATGGHVMRVSSKGGCHCGALRYRLEGDLGDVAHCHCSICRRVSGGTLVTWVTLPARISSGWRARRSGMWRRLGAAAISVVVVGPMWRW